MLDYYVFRFYAFKKDCEFWYKIFFFLWLIEKYYEYVCFFVFFFFLNEYLGCWMILSGLFHVVLGFVF